MKKEINLVQHGFYILCLTLFTLLVCLGFFLFSFDTLLSYFNYPLIGPFVTSSIFSASFSSSLACILPPLFLIGALRHYGLKERFMRMFEVQAFFFLVLVIIFSGFMFYNVQLNDNVAAIMNTHYFSTLTRLLLGFYFYLSIKICLASQDMPLPSNSDNINGLQEKLGKELANNLQNEFTFHNDEPFDSKASRNKVWKKHQQKIPQIVKSSLGFAQFLGFLLLGLVLFPILDVPPATFGVNYSFLSVFFLYFYLLYQMRLRPYGVWRFAYICLNLYILIAYGFNAIFPWQAILLVFFLGQCFVFYVLYRKSENWFL